ncbi:MAG: response regulator transcription factor [Phormidesmis sp.]
MTQILIFEDDDRLSAYWKTLLEAEDYTAECCSTMKESLIVMEQTPPDLIIVDMLIKQGGRLVAEGGLTLIAKLKLQSIDFRGPIIGVSGMKKGPFLRSTPLDIAKQMGIDVALYKPVCPDQLLQTVERLLK